MRREKIRRSVLPFLALFFLAVAVDVQAADGIETAGDVLTAVLPTAAAGMMVWQKDGPGAIQFGASAGLSLAVTYSLKYTVDARRPNGEDHSFPSAHTSVSFNSAEFLRKRYGWQYGLPAYLAAAFVAYSRVEAEQHYTRDVIAGAGIGVLSAYLCTETYQGWRIQPEAGQAYYGLLLTRHW